jgi:alkylhydroperoxidase/carboxymuconolactone decarboxylase family protein YurZ
MTERLVDLPEDTQQPEGWQRSGTVRLQYIELLKEYAPEYIDAYSVWDRQADNNTELDAKARELVIIAIDTVIMYPYPYIDSHIHKAFNAGATVRELIEVAVTCGRLMGPHAMNYGLRSLYRAVKEREALGLETPHSKTGVPT